ncbi:cytochrome b5-like heme/steroid binding domain-containing protein [Gaertneriomyces semiglobifer]|nr:cytochrome b5-like heme/steroid binding domain-containing protein [Gaertneriomyces semiglobifer]
MFPMLGGPQRLDTGLRGRKKVPLEPGHSPLDWARLTASGKDLRGVPQIQKYTLSDVAQHRSRDDLWMAICGKVYNVTSYLKFHPGGAGQLMRGAGKDATELFMKVHPWVNVDTLLDKCLVGFLVQ